MAKHTYRVEWRGAEIKRTTDRVYTFVTVSLGHSLERETELIAGEIRVVNQNLNYYRGKLAAGDTRWETVEQIQRDITRNEERLALLEAEDPEPRTQRVCEWGWSSRRDLAQKNAEKAAKLGYRQVTVLEVPQP